MKDTSLVIKRGPKLEFVSHTHHSHLLLGFCKDVKFAIRELKTRNPMFVMEYMTYNWILGQHFLNSVKFTQEHRLDDILDTITHLQTQQFAVF